MSSNNEPPDNNESKPKVVERKLRDNVSAVIGGAAINESVINGGSVTADSSTVTADGDAVVAGKGNLNAQGSTIQAKGKVVKAKTANIKVEGLSPTITSGIKITGTTNESIDENIDDIKDTSPDTDGALDGESISASSDDSLSAKGSVTQAPEGTTYSSLNDSLSSIDTIGYAPYVKALAKFICHKDTQVPLVVGIFGEWGAGKTSFMDQLQKEVSLKQKSKNKQVWFNAWKYDNQSDLWAALLQAITSQVESDTNYLKVVIRRFRRLVSWKFSINMLLVGLIFWFLGGAEVLPKYSELVKAANSETMLGIGLQAVLAIFPPGIAILLFYWVGALKPIVELVRKIKNPLGLDVNELVNGKNLPDRVEGIRVFDNDLKDRLSDYLDSDGRLIIYIDDLDRCSPEHAVEIIEAVNLFLDTERCIFVLGMDHKLISSAIELKYKELSALFKDNDFNQSLRKDNMSYGEFFLKKIIQVPITIPPMSIIEVNKFTKSLMKTQTVEPTTTEESSNVVSNENDTTNDLDISISSSSMKVISSLLPYMKRNPRSIKRFYNMHGFIQFFYIANKGNLKGVNDVALTMWFFLVFTYPKEIESLQRVGSVSWGELIAGYKNQCPNIRDFFTWYMATPDNVDVLNSLNGEIKDYFHVTRILEM